jgi:hypothetical protein
MSSLSHAGFSGYLLRARLNPGPPRVDGSVALVFDGNMRVVLHPASHGDIVFEAQLVVLPDAASEADEVLSSALAMAGQRESHEADCLVLSPEEDRLLLQQRVGADASADEFEGSLGNFLNALTGWRAHLGVL